MANGICLPIYLYQNATLQWYILFHALDRIVRVSRTKSSLPKSSWPTQLDPIKFIAMNWLAYRNIYCRLWGMCVLHGHGDYIHLSPRVILSIPECELLMLARGAVNRPLTGRPAVLCWACGHWSCVKSLSHSSGLACVYWCVCHLSTAHSIPTWMRKRTYWSGFSSPLPWRP